MNIPRSPTILLIPLLLFMVISSPVPGEASPAKNSPAENSPRDLTPSEYERMLTHIMDGRSDLAQQELDALSDTCAGRPQYLLARARLMLEFIPLNNDDPEITKELLEPIYPLLDAVQDYCDAGLDQDSSRIDLHYYRGISWMIRSQAKAYQRSFYSAGRDAGKGKSDLETYLESHPDDPIANGLLGAFLYFTDAVPELFQFLSKLLFLPTGDRGRGLEMIRTAVATDGPSQLDYAVLDARVSFFFEGRFEDGLARNNALLDRFPRYPRLAVASATMAVLDPRHSSEHLELSGRTLALLQNHDGPEDVTLETLRAAHGWATRLMVGHDAARNIFAEVAASDSKQPAWIPAFALLQLSEMAALEGRFDEALALAAELDAHPHAERFKEQAEAMLADLSKRPANRPGSSIQAAFKAADALLIAGDERGAGSAYRALVRREIFAWEKVYRLLAEIRLGEIAAARDNYLSAARWLGRAAAENSSLDRLAWTLQGRQRYYEEIEWGGQGPKTEPFMRQNNNR